jgi:PadR family transcriptional regulator, regulatory protein PadR
MIGRQQEAILATLLSLKTEATTNDVHEVLGGRHSLPAIFIALDRMAKKKLVEVRKGDPIPQRGGKARLYYKITPSGKAALTEVRRAQAFQNSLIPATVTGEDDD